MAQKFLSIKNFEKYQHYKHRNPPWIKLHLDILDDADFLKMPDASKWHYVGMLLLSSRHENKIPADDEYVTNRLGLRSKLDLSQRFIKDHLLASCKRIASILHTNADSETEKSRDRVETETETEQHAAASPSVLSKLDAFSITPELEAWAAKESIPDPSAYLEEFKDYWRSVGGKRRNGQTIQSWPAAFKNRLRDLKKTNKLKTPDWQEEFLREQA